MTFLISAGEASSELYGAQLIVALRRRARAADEPVRFLGAGGKCMRSAGCEIVVDAQRLAVMGMTEIIAHLPDVYRQLQSLLRAVDALPEKPAAAIVIDSPAFNFRVARAMHKRGIPVLYFVAPQLWAWRQYRVKRMQRWVKKVLCIFPFEAEFYRRHGVDVEYVGHPLADLPPPQISREQFARENQLDAEKHWIALLPGSRRKEIRMNLPVMLEAAKRLPGHEFVAPLASTIERGWMVRQISAQEEGGAGLHIHLVEDARSALRHCRAAAIASGTATVEAALMGTPFVAVYRLSPLTFLAARHLVKVPHVAMPNLVAGRKIVPELLQNDFTAEKLAAELVKILAEGGEREQMLAAMAEVRQALRFPHTAHGESQASAVERAAAAVMEALPADLPRAASRRANL